MASRIKPYQDFHTAHWTVDWIGFDDSDRDFPGTVGSLDECLRYMRTAPPPAPGCVHAERHGVAVLAVRHLTKGGSGNLLYRGLGSIGVIASARSALLIGPDPGADEPSHEPDDDWDGEDDGEAEWLPSQ